MIIPTEVHRDHHDQMIKIKMESFHCPPTQISHALLLKLFIHDHHHFYENNLFENNKKSMFFRFFCNQFPWGMIKAERVCVHSSFMENPLVDTQVTLLDMHFLPSVYEKEDVN